MPLKYLCFELLGAASKAGCIMRAYPLFSSPHNFLGITEMESLLCFFKKSEVYNDYAMVQSQRLL